MPITWEAETAGPQVQDQTELHSKTVSKQNRIKTPVLIYINRHSILLKGLFSIIDDGTDSVSYAKDRIVNKTEKPCLPEDDIWTGIQI